VTPVSIAENETFGATFPFKANYFVGHGFRQHYVDEGPREAEVIVCLHGEPTWGYLYRNFITPLSRTWRVVVPDHMGFGKSDTPADGDYTLSTHVANLEALFDHLDLRNITFVVQDWGGAMAGAYTLRNPDRVNRLMLMNTYLGYGGIAMNGVSPWFQWIGKHHEAGTLDGILGELGSTVLSVMKITGFTNSVAVTDDWLRAYSAPFPDRASCVGAIAFPLDYLLGRIRPFIVDCIKTGDMEALLAKPAMLAYGMADKAIEPAHAIADFEALYPGRPVVRLPGVGHYCQEDAPGTLVALISQFIQAT
jgi:pimeloyl-ACP methyl ester carboxylesterase